MKQNSITTAEITNVSPTCGKPTVGSSTVYLMDCVEGMKEYPDKWFDLAICDPPYGIDVQKQRIGSERKTDKWANPKKYEYEMFDDSKPPSSEYWIQLFRVSKNQIIWGGNYFTEHLSPSKGWIVWDKQVDIKEHLSMCELAWSSFDRKCNKFDYLWAGFKKKHQVERIHPTQKPVDLYRWTFMHYAEKGQKVIDTHLGSGSSRIAAHEAELQFVGFENNQIHFNNQEERFANYVCQPRLF